MDDVIARIKSANGTLRYADAARSIMLSYGVYQIDDPAMAISSMCDRAQAAKRTVKGNYANYIGVFDERLHKQQRKRTRAG